MYTGIPLDKYTSKFLFMELIERLGKIKELNKNVKLFIIHSLNYLAQNPEVSEIEALGFLLETIEEIVPQIDERNRINIVNQVIKYAEDPSKILLFYIEFEEMRFIAEYKNGLMFFSNANENLSKTQSFAISNDLSNGLTQSEIKPHSWTYQES